MPSRPGSGAKPKPATLKLLEGRGHGRDSGGRVVPTPPAFKRVPPEPPDDLSDFARAEWERVVPELVRLDLLTEATQAGLRAYCEAVEAHVEASKLVHANGITLTNPVSGMQHVNPALTAQLKAGAAIRAWAEQFGFTPSAEMRLARTGGAPDDEDTNPFSEGSAATAEG